MLPVSRRPQNDMMVSTINSIHTAGGSVGYVSLLLGGNDLQYLAASPAFQTALANGDQVGLQTMLGTLLGTIQSNYLHALGELKALAPEATILLPGYYNPYAPLGPGYAPFGQAIQAFNQMIAADAAGTPGAKYVDLYTPFVGKELAADQHRPGRRPPQPGRLRGDRRTAARLPPRVLEPSSILIFSAGIAGMAVVMLRGLVDDSGTDTAFAPESTPPPSPSRQASSIFSGRLIAGMAVVKLRRKRAA